MTWLFPLLAAFVTWRRGSRGASPTNTTEEGSISDNASRSRNQPLKLAVLIPAHNEAVGLAKTITSLKKNFKPLVVEGVLDYTIFVGADGCTDATAEVGLTYGAVVSEFSPNQGKWRTLQALLHQVPQDIEWIGLLDAGIEWSAAFATILYPLLFNRDVAGIAPSYRQKKSSFAEKLAWSLERHLKSVENYSGGPISVHGATVFYRKESLLAAMLVLAEDSGVSSDTLWLNDDVVIPLALRTHLSENALLYVPKIESIDLTEDVVDRSTLPFAGSNLTRRLRMARGNLQWISARFWRKNTVVRLLVGRRIARLLWAYWGGCLALGFVLLVAQTLVIPRAFVYLLLAAVVLSTRSARVRTAFQSLQEPIFASLLVPVLFIKYSQDQEVAWK